MEGITIHLLPKGNWTGASVFEPETKHSDPMRITIMVLSSNTIKQKLLSQQFVPVNAKTEDIAGKFISLVLKNFHL